MVLATHNVKVLGSGSRVVVLGHGFGTDQSCFQHIVPTLLQKDLRVILYDVMGAGSTNTDGFNFKRYSTHHAHADDLLAILDELEIQSCVYVGHSMSGMVGCTASIERPEVFEKLILLGASPRYCVNFGRMPTLARTGLFKILRFRYGMRRVFRPCGG